MVSVVTSAIEWQYKFSRAMHFQQLRTIDLLQTALALSGEALGAASGCITLFDAGGTLTHAFLLGNNDTEASRDLWQRLITHGVIAFAHYGGRGIVIERNSQDTRWLQTAMPTPLFANGSSIAVPIRHQDTRQGVIALAHDKPAHFDQRALDLLTSFAEITGATLHNASLIEMANTREAGFRRLAERVQQERAERRLHEQLQHDLAAMTYHDLRGPLQNVQTSLSGLQRVIKRGDPQMIEEFVGIAMGSARQMGRMVKGLLDIERMEQGRTIVNRARTSAEQVVGDVVKLLQPIAADAEQTLTHEVQPDLPMLYVDGDMLVRVLSNLVENAIKHTAPGGHILVNAWAQHQTEAADGSHTDEAQNDFLIMEVADNGPGIPAHLLDQIFDKFVRVKYQDAPSGVGLGLAFCRLAIEAHGGRIWVESELGKGASFKIALPLAQNLPPDPAPAETALLMEETRSLA